MALKQDAEIKYKRLFRPKELGLLPKVCDERVLLETCVRISVIGNATVQIRAKLTHEKTYTDLQIISADSTDLVDVSTWDMLEYEILTLSGKVEIAASGFFFKKNTPTTAETNSFDNKESYEAGETISALKIVRLTDMNTVITANNLTCEAAHAIGITCTAATAGNAIDVLTFGKVEDPSFGFTGTNTAIFLDDNGNITDVAPISGQYVILGQSLGAGAIFLNINSPIELC